MIRRIFVFFIVIAALSVYLPSLYSMGTRPPREHIPLRVLVKKNIGKVTLRVKGAYRIVDFESREVLTEGRKLRKMTLYAEDIDSEGISILAERKSRIYILNRQFRGDIDIIKDKSGKLMVINRIDVEDYLYGVLYHEVSHRWPMEVLKAQAIAARTYALYQKFVSKNKYFDLTSDIYSQVYGGRISERWRTTRAVNLTQGEVLTYNDKIFPSYYHSACGGRTSRANTIWDIDIPPLRGSMCNFCKRSPHYKWKKELSMEDIENKLKGDHKVSVIAIEILKKDETGRVLSILLKGRDKDVELSGNKFRLLMGPNRIKSTNFEVQIKGKYITFYGKGWGHGIGMCQWGAYYMAKKRRKVDEILRHYYPGAEIVRVE